MGWWPFRKKPATYRPPDVIRRDTRSWLSDLQDICERNFDSPEEARRLIRQMTKEWEEANSDGVMDDDLFEGLNMRAFRLLNSSDVEFTKWLDDLSFWKPGWRPEGSRDTDNS
tara:strand:- start:1515 stop:1853 length:339 start_codon:yes stop_codon:yes gene_type:complete